MIVGSGDYRYRVNADWAKLPEGWSFKEVGGVGVDSHDNVYVFNRGDHPMMVFDRDGNFLRSWGEGQYPRAHGVHVTPDDTMFLTDDGGHFVRKVTLDGKVLLELGVPGKPAPFMSGEPFHRCTHTALSPQGEIYVSDGYGNSRVHKYTPDGKLLLSWGEPGTGEGEFNIVHNICCDADGWVYVADRENHRVQVFDGNGKFETQWQNLHRPCGLCMPYGHQADLLCRRGRPGRRGQPRHPQPRPAGQHRRSSRQADRPLWRHTSGNRARQIPGAAWTCRRLARRCLCRRGFVDRMAADLSRHAAARPHPLAAEVRKGRLRAEQA